MIKQLKKISLWVVLLLVLAIVTHWRWFFMDAYFGWGDSSFHLLFRENWLSLFKFPYMWSFLFNEYGGVNVSLSSFFAYFLPASLVHLGFSPSLAVKLAILLPSPILALFGSFVLIKYFTRNNLAGFVGAIVYTFNVYFLLTESGATQAAISFALAPLILVFFAKTLDRKSFTSAIITGLLCFLSASHEARFFYITAHLLLFYLLFKIFLVDFFQPVKKKLGNLVYAAIPLLVLALLSLYWLLPYLFTGTLSNNEIFTRGLFGDKYMSLRQSVTMMCPWWTGGQGYADFSVQPIPSQFWLIPIFVILGVVLNIKKKITYYFLFIALIGIFLTKQSDVPFPSAYLWLFQHYPGFNAFREASKFYFVLALGYSFLIAQIFVWFHEKSKVFPWIRFASLLVAGEILSIFLWNTKPLIDGSIESMFKPRILPAAYTQVKDFLLTDQEFSRTLWVPAANGWTYFDQDHPKNSLHNSHFSKWGYILSLREDYQPLENRSQTIDKTNHQALGLFNQVYTQNFLNLLSVKYIFVPKQEADVDMDMFWITGIDDRDYVIKLLDSLRFLRRVDIGTSEIIAFENSTYKPHIYLSNQMESIFTPTDTITIPIQSINPTEYRITIPNLSAPVFLNFSDSYHPDWNLYVGKFDRFKILNGKSNSFPEELHFKNDATFNSFLIDPAYIEAHFPRSSYQINSDGSMSVDLTLYFMPQTYVYIGLAATTVTVLLFTTGVFLVRRKLKK